MIANPDPQLVFGGLNLIGTDAELTAQGYRFEALGDNMDWGNPVPIDEKIISWLQDGALIARKSYDNREMNIRVQIVGTDSDKVAIGESALMGEVGKPNLLTWTPPDGDGEPCVFSVVMSSIEFALNDIDEVRELRVRTYALKVQAEPFARAADLVTVTKPAPSGAQVITTIDDCTSFTGWAASFAYSPAGTSTNTSGNSGGQNFAKMANVALPPSGVAAAWLTRTGLTADITATPYIRAVARVDSSGLTGALQLGRFEINGVVVPVALQEGDSYWFDTTGLGLGSTITSFKARAHFINPVTPTAYGELHVFDLSRSNVLGTQATGRQLSRNVEVAGSARTQGNLALADASDSLGTTLVYTAPAAPGILPPPIGSFLTSFWTPSVDATTVSGYSLDISTLSGPAEYSVPISGIQSGGHLLLARVKDTSSGPREILWSAVSRLGSNALLPGQFGTTAFEVVANEWKVVCLATLNLPPVKVGPDGIVHVTIQDNIDGLAVDEVWLFNIETGRLSWVECGDGSPAAGGDANRLWLDAASVATPAPLTWVGTEADRSDEYFAGDKMFSAMQHEFLPPTMSVFTVTTNSQAADLTLEHYPRFPTHVVAG